MTLGASPNSFLYAASGGGWTGMLALLKLVESAEHAMGITTHGKAFAKNILPS
jgi:aspartate-semialdehyde dehydrogenase